MSFPKDFMELLPYIVFVVALEVFYSYTLKRHYEEMKKLRDEKAALLEILLAFLRHKPGIQQPGKVKSKDEEARIN